MSNNTDKYKDMLKPKENVYDHLIDNPDDKDNEEANVNASVDVNLSNIPVARAKKGIRETHKTKAFYIRKDIAKLIDADIQRGQRGDMTKIVNALFEEYYKSQGRLK